MSETVEGRDEPRRLSRRHLRGRLARSPHRRRQRRDHAAGGNRRPDLLTASRLSVFLSPDRRLVLDAEGLSDDVLEAASDAGGIRDHTLESLVSGCLDLDPLGGEADPIGDLTTLRGQMARALARLDTTVEQLKKRTR